MLSFHLWVDEEQWSWDFLLLFLHLWFFLIDIYEHLYLITFYSLYIHLDSNSMWTIVPWKFDWLWAIFLNFSILLFIKPLNFWFPYFIDVQLQRTFLHHSSDQDCSTITEKLDQLEIQQILIFMRYLILYLLISISKLYQNH